MRLIKEFRERLPVHITPLVAPRTPHAARRTPGLIFRESTINQILEFIHDLFSFVFPEKMFTE